MAYRAKVNTRKGRALFRRTAKPIYQKRPGLKRGGIRL